MGIERPRRRRFLKIFGAAALGALALLLLGDEIVSTKKPARVSTTTAASTSSSSTSIASIPTTTSVLSTTAESTSVSESETTSVDTSTPDYQTFVAPYQSQFDSLCSWLMQGYDPSIGRPGYYVDSEYGEFILGDNACYQCQGGNIGNIIVLAETNLIISRYLDYWNRLNGNLTSIESSVRALWQLGKSFVWGTPCAQGSTNFTYDYLEKHELFFGTSPGSYVLDQNFGNGTTGPDAPGGYPFVPGRTPGTNQCSGTPAIGVIVNGPNQLGPNEVVAQNVIFYALNQYLLGNVQEAQDQFNNLVNDWTGTDFNKYKGEHNGNNHQAVAWGAFVHGSRAMGFIWSDSNALSVAKEVAAQCWTLQNSDGGIMIALNASEGPNWNQRGAEPSAYVGIAFDPRVPSWFPSPS